MNETIRNYLIVGVLSCVVIGLVALDCVGTSNSTPPPPPTITITEGPTLAPVSGPLDPIRNGASALRGIKKAAPYINEGAKKLSQGIDAFNAEVNGVAAEGPPCIQCDGNSCRVVEPQEPEEAEQECSVGSCGYERAPLLRRLFRR